MLRKFIRRYGLIITTITFTLIIILLSITVTHTILYIMGNRLDSVSLITSILVPTIITPIFSVLILGLIQQLDQAELRLATLSNTDDLTQTYNRRYFMQYSEKELEQVKDSGGVFSIAILDVDNFKEINDSYGHLIGDRVLLELAQLFRKNIRKTEIVARFGGDEFIFFFPGQDRQQVIPCVERIYGLLDKKPIIVDNLRIRPVFSMGVATYNTDVNKLDDMLKQADRALYQAKKLGGNQPVMA